MIVMDQLVDKFSRLSISDSIQILEVSKEFDFGTVMTEEINPESNLGFTSEVLSPYPLGLCNAIFIYQELLQGRVNPAQEIPLTGAQRGHVLSVTLQGFIVHWPGSHPDDSYPDSSRVIAMAEILPYQDGDSLPGDDHTTMEILESSDTTESATNRVFVHAREVFMVRGRSPLSAPTPLDINSNDESPSLFPLMHSELRMRQKPRRPRGKRRISRGRDAASGLIVNDRVRLITKLGWSNMIANT
jgi:hypothetical protein